MKPEKRGRFDVESFLDSAKVPRKKREFAKNEVIFSQGDRGSTVMFLQEGSVKLTVVSHSGREAVVAILGPGDFFGEWSLPDQHVRLATAIAFLPSKVFAIDKREMLRALHSEHELCSRFILYMIERSLEIEQDLIDLLFNPTEKRIARALLRLARYGKQERTGTTLPKVTQQMLAEMVRTTRPRVNFFMNKFRKLGLIDYDGELRIHRSLVNVMLHN